MLPRTIKVRDPRFDSPPPQAKESNRENNGIMPFGKLRAFGNNGIMEGKI